MDQFLQLLAGGLGLGTIYALVALGFVVIYRASQVFNFAQGELVATGAYAMVALHRAGLPWPVALVGSMVVTGLLGAAVERTVLRPLVGRPVFATIIITIFVGALIRVFLLATFGPDEMGMPTPWDTMATVQVGGTRIGVNALASVAAGAVALGAFFFLIRRTRLGVAMRATAADQETALALGIPVGRIFGATWFLAGAYAALAGIFLAMFPNHVDGNLGFIALRAFPAVIVGGLDSAGGTVIAGLLLGVAEILCQGYVNQHLGAFGQDFHTVFPYAAMIVFLMVRPHGLFGTKEVERV